MSSAPIVRPEASVSTARGSRATARSDSATSASSNSGSAGPAPLSAASTASRTASSEPTFSAADGSEQFESPEITCSRRNRLGSANGSSRVLISGRERVVIDDNSSCSTSARWLIAKPSGLHRPLPQSTCRVTRNGVSTAASPGRSSARGMQ